MPDAGDLAHLRHVPAGSRADHHVDRVEPLRLELGLHRLLHLRVASVQMLTSCWRRSPSVMMPRLNCVSTFSAWAS